VVCAVSSFPICVHPWLFSGRSGASRFGHRFEARYSQKLLYARRARWFNRRARLKTCERPSELSLFLPFLVAVTV
jgi:hypothetical protein